MNEFRVVAACVAVVSLEIDYGGPDKANLAYQNPKIIGGSACKLDNKTSFMIALTNMMGEHQCGGSLVNAYWILTAAHCKYRNTMYASDVFTRAKHVDKKGVLSWWAPVTKIIKVIVHPEYNEKTMENDIALMKLEKRMRLTRVHTVKLPINKVPADVPDFCPTAAIMGWGYINRDVRETPMHLQCAEIKTISHSDCAEYFISKKLIHKATICTEVNEETDSCSGDSGGPLMCGDVQYGIVSWGIGCASEDFPAVYTRVDYYLNFIHHSQNSSPRSIIQILQRSKLLIVFILSNKSFIYI